MSDEKLKQTADLETTLEYWVSLNRETETMATILQQWRSQIHEVAKACESKMRLTKSTEAFDRVMRYLPDMASVLMEASFHLGEVVEKYEEKKGLKSDSNPLHLPPLGSAVQDFRSCASELHLWPTITVGDYEKSFSYLEERCSDLEAAHDSLTAMLSDWKVTLAALPSWSLSETDKAALVEGTLRWQGEKAAFFEWYEISTYEVNDLMYALGCFLLSARRLHAKLPTNAKFLTRPLLKQLSSLCHVIGAYGDVSPGELGTQPLLLETIDPAELNAIQAKLEEVVKMFDKQARAIRLSDFAARKQTLHLLNHRRPSKMRKDK